MKSLKFIAILVVALAVAGCSTSAEGSVGGKASNSIANPIAPAK